MLPAWVVRTVLDDPRDIPYLLVWKSYDDGKIKDAVRINRAVPATQLPEDDSVDVKRSDGTLERIFLRWRNLPRNGGRTLSLRCWRCQKTSRALYGWRVGSDGRFYVAQRADWMCRVCAELSYSSEGGALLHRGWLNRLFQSLGDSDRDPRPVPLYPMMFSSLDQAVERLGL